MVEERAGLALAWLRTSRSAGYLYAIGGTTCFDQAVECIKLTVTLSRIPQQDSHPSDEALFIGRAWRLVSPSLLPRRDMAVATTKGAIIIAGGFRLGPFSQTFEHATCVVEMFTPIGRNGDGRWTELASLNTPRTLVGLFPLNQGLIALSTFLLLAGPYTPHSLDMLNMGRCAMYIFQTLLLVTKEYMEVGPLFMHRLCIHITSTISTSTT